VNAINVLIKSKLFNRASPFSTGGTQVNAQTNIDVRSDLLPTTTRIGSKILL